MSQFPVPESKIVTGETLSAKDSAGDADRQLKAVNARLIGGEFFSQSRTMPTKVMDEAGKASVMNDGRLL
jgi:hypothetical protein